jgi:beta-lactam-binding protein with PASTA domain
VPDIRHLALNDAVAKLRAAGLEAGRQSEHVDLNCGIDINKVSGQSPSAGKKVRPGSAVDYTVDVLPSGNQHCN